MTERVISTNLIIAMRRISGKHLLCFFLLVAPLSWADDARRDVRKADNDIVWNQQRTRRLFARQKVSPPQQSHIHKQKTNLIPPARRCGRLMESCSSYVPCCDPCASCHCRLFNTICHCWRINSHCLQLHEEQNGDPEIQRCDKSPASASPRRNIRPNGSSIARTSVGLYSAIPVGVSIWMFYCV